MVVENRPARAAIAAEAVVKRRLMATILLAGSFLTIGPSLNSKLPYGAGHRASQAHRPQPGTARRAPRRAGGTAKELIALARSRGQLNYGSSGVGAPPHRDDS